MTSSLPPLVPTQVLREVIPTHLANQKACFLQDRSLVLVYDCSGATRGSVLYNPASGQVVRRIRERLGSSSVMPARHVTLHQHLLVHQEDGGGFHSHDVQTRETFSLHNPLRLTGSALLQTARGLYVMGGQDQENNSLRDFFYYCPVGRNLSTLQNWQTLTPILVKRRDATAIQVNGNIYLIGGYHWNRVRYTACHATEVYDGRHWTLGPDLVVARRSPSVVVVRNSIVVLGGVGVDGQVVDTIEVWNLETLSFVVWGRLEYPRPNVSAVVVNDEILLFCGNSVEVERIVFRPEGPASHDSLGAGMAVVPGSSGASIVEPDHDMESPTDVTLPVGNASLPRVAIPRPPVPPSIPITATSSERYEALCHYIEKLEKLQVQYQQTLESCTERVKQVYDKARDDAIDDLHFHGQLWLSDSERLVRDARRELESLQPFVQNDDDHSWLKQADEHDYYLDDIPSQLRCPITLNLMTDPVVAADGNTYDRAALEEWFRTQGASKRPLSPLTGARLPSKHYYPVNSLKALCQQFAKQKQRQTNRKKPRMSPAAQLS